MEKSIRFRTRRLLPLLACAMLLAGPAFTAASTLAVPTGGDASMAQMEPATGSDSIPEGLLPEVPTRSDWSFPAGPPVPAEEDVRPLMQGPTAAQVAASMPYIEALEAASTEVAVSVQMGVIPDPIEIVVPVDLVIPAGVRLDIPLLNILVLGDLTIDGGELHLYGASLRLRNEQTGYVTEGALASYGGAAYYTLRPDALQPYPHINILNGGVIEANDLHDYPAGIVGDLLRSLLANQPSLLEESSGTILETVETGLGLGPTLNAVGITSYPYPLLITAAAGTAALFEDSIMRGVFIGYYFGSLTVNRMTVENSWTPFLAYGPGSAGAAVQDSSFHNVNVGFYLYDSADGLFARNAMSHDWAFDYGVFGYVAPSVRVVDNQFAGPRWAVAITAGPDAEVARNQVSNFHYGGIALAGATRSLVADNVLAGYTGTGVSVAASNPAVVERNTVGPVPGYRLVYGILFGDSVGSADDNAVAGAWYGITATQYPYSARVTDVRARGNTVTDMSAMGIWVANGGALQADDNVITRVQTVSGAYYGGYGIYSTRDGINPSHTSLSASRNTVTDSGYGIVAHNSHTYLADNVATDNLGSGITVFRTSLHAGYSPPDVDIHVFDNQAHRNGFGSPTPDSLRAGLELMDAPAKTLSGNHMDLNAVGVSIDYASRASLAVASDNWVDWRNFDGTMVAADRSYWYAAACASPLTFAGVTDSGTMVAGHLSAQGVMTFYDCDAVSVSGGNFRDNGFGVMGIGLRSLRVTDSTFEDFHLRYYGLLNNYDTTTLSGGIYGHSALDLAFQRNTVTDTIVGIRVRTSGQESPVTDNSVLRATTAIWNQETPDYIDRNTISVADTGILVTSGAVSVSHNVIDQIEKVGIDMATGGTTLVDNTVTTNGIGGCLSWLPCRWDVRLRQAPTEVIGGTYGVADFGFDTDSVLDMDDTLVQFAATGVRVAAGVLNANGLTVTDAPTAAISATGSSLDLSALTLLRGTVGLSASNGGGKMEDCRISGFTTGLFSASASFTRIGHCAFTNNGNGLHVTGGQLTQVFDSVLADNNIGAKRMVSGSLFIKNSHLLGNTDAAVEHTGDGSVMSTDNYWGGSAPPTCGGGAKNCLRGNVLAFSPLANPIAGVGPITV